METLIEEKINTFKEEAKSYNAALGSDEHLDDINSYRKPIVKITIKLAALNKVLSTFLNTDESISQKDVKLLKTLVTLNAKVFVAFKNSSNYKFVKEAVNDFDEERQLTKEIVNDFIAFRVSSEKLNKLKEKLKNI